MVEARIEPTFASWREAARGLLARGVMPEEVFWSDGREEMLPLLAGKVDGELAGVGVRVPREFMTAAEMVAMHRDAGRWGLLYRVLYRMARGEPRLMEIEVDEDVYRLRAMERSVRRDIHKMHVFVRFRRVEAEDGEMYVAFHRPDHLIVPAAAPWFARRFAVMRWTILTPDASAVWDGERLTYGAGVAAGTAADDGLEELWRTYYANIFNPARMKLKAMKKEMPVRHWRTLPEAEVIEALIRKAPVRVEGMISATRGSEAVVGAAGFVPRTMELAVLKEAARGCRGCGLYCDATQTVFGEGAAGAALMIVGEQPGDQEDLAGRPFVGPAGQLLEEALVKVGIDRKACYVTNAVKHFKFEERGKRRIHMKPGAKEVMACRPWLEAEVGIVKPRMIVALGATAAQAMLGAGVRITRDHGRVVRGSEWAPWWMATIHPSALLRIPDAGMRERAYAEFLADLGVAARELRGHEGKGEGS